MSMTKSQIRNLITFIQEEIMMITSEALVLACSAIGAGLAMIAGLGPVSDRELQQDMQQQR